MILDAHGLYKLSRRGRDRKSREVPVEAVTLCEQLLDELVAMHIDGSLDEVAWEDGREVSEHIGQIVRAQR